MACAGGGPVVAGAYPVAAARPHCCYCLLARERGAIALLEDLTLGSVTSGALMGLGVLVAAPLLVPVVGAVVRPVVRLAVHSGIAAYDAAAALVTTAGTELTQMVAAARATDQPTTLGSPATPPLDVAPHILRLGEA